MSGRAQAQSQAAVTIHRPSFFEGAEGLAYAERPLPLACSAQPSTFFLIAFRFLLTISIVYMAFTGPALNFLKQASLP